MYLLKLAISVQISAEDGLDPCKGYFQIRNLRLYFQGVLHEFDYQ